LTTPLEEDAAENGAAQGVVNGLKVRHAVVNQADHGDERGVEQDELGAAVNRDVPQALQWIHARFEEEHAQENQQRPGKAHPGERFALKDDGKHEYQ